MNEELLEILKDMDLDAFERLAMRLVREAGFVNLEVTPSSGDEGIGGVVVYKPSLVSFPIYFQCKRYRGSVGPSVVRDFRGAMTGQGREGPSDHDRDLQSCGQERGHPGRSASGRSDRRLGLSVEQRVDEDVTIEPSFFDSI